MPPHPEVTMTKLNPVKLGTVDCPASLLPQQNTVPLIVIPHE